MVSVNTTRLQGGIHSPGVITSMAGRFPGWVVFPHILPATLLKLWRNKMNDERKSTLVLVLSGIMAIISGAGAICFNSKRVLLSFGFFAGYYMAMFTIRGYFHV